MPFQDRDPQSGITLIEMLVSLAIFSLIGLASFTVLDTLLKARLRTEGQLERIAQYDRALALFDYDVTQGAPGSLRLEGGEFAFQGRGQNTYRYHYKDGAFMREISFLDAPGDALSQSLVSDAVGAEFRILTGSGNWHDAWPVTGLEDPAVAIEMTLKLPAQRDILRLVQLTEAVPE